jgi:hypothetical protein
MTSEDQRRVVLVKLRRRYNVVVPLIGVWKLELLGGGLSVMRILNFRDFNIRLIGSLQSRVSIPCTEVICDVVTVSDGLSRFGEGAG